MSEQIILSERTKESLDKYFSNQYNKDIFVSKYLKENPEKSNKDSRFYDQTVEECFQNIIDEAFSVSCEDENSEKYKKVIFDLMYKGVFRPGGSIINGLNHKERKISLMNCTTLMIEKDTLESIFETLYEAAKMAAYRQGLGVLFSNIRPRNAKVNNSAEISEGSVHWMKPFNSIGDMCGQKKRKPAILGAQICHHPDIFEFIECKDKLDEFNNMNLSVHITDKFMEAVKNDDDWELYFKTDEINVSYTIKARELFDKICHHAWKTGEPGIIFIDRMRKWSIQEAFGYKIVNVNACSEKPLPDRGLCLLGSINVKEIPHIYKNNKILSNINENKKFHEFLKEIIYPIVRFMDNIAQYEIDHDYKSPNKKQLKVLKELREIGLGVTNLAEWLFDQGIPYDSDISIKVCNELFKWICYYTWKASIQLAKERGPCPAYLKIRRKHIDEKTEFKETDYLKFIFNEFPDLKKNFYSFGIRNGALLSIAPTGSLSSTLPKLVLSTGIEPLMAPYYWRKTRATNMDSTYEYYFTIPDKIKELLLEKLEKMIQHESDVQLKTILENDYNKIKNFEGSIKDDDGEIGKEYIKIINEYLDFNKIKPAHKINPYKKIQLMSTIQKWIDAAISVTYNLPEDFPEEEVKKLYLEAYNHYLKSMTVYRDGSREGIYIFIPPNEYKEKIKNLLKKDISCIKRPEDILYHCSPKRPDELPCDIHHCMVKGKPWIVFIGKFKGKPFEIFAGEYDKNIMHVPKKLKNGIIKRVKEKNKTKYNLEIKIRNSKVIYEDIPKLFMNEEFRTATRLLSLSMRSGVYPEFIVQQIKKSNPELTDFYAVVARVLNKYITEVKFINKKQNKCPNCNNESLIREGGCQKCLECGYSRCD